MTGWSLRRRLNSALVVSAVVVGLIIATVALLLAAVDRSQSKVYSYFDALRIGNNSFTSLVDAETSIRGYALTGDRSYLKPLLDLQADAAKQKASGKPTDGERLRAAVQDDPRILAALDKAGAAAQSWYTGWAQPTIAMIDKGTRPDTAQLSEGKQRFDVVRKDYTQFIETVREARDRAVEQARSRVRILLGVVLGGAVGAAFVGVGLWRALRRWVTGPIEGLAAETREVSSGDLQHEVVAHGPPEFQALGADVEAMRKGLLTQLAVVEEAKTAAERARGRVEEQAEELRRSNRDLEQFAYVASHDLQEPLRKVASFCQLLEKRYKGQLDERADQYIEFAVDGAKRMQQLINDLLSFSRVGRLSTGVSEVDLGECLSRALRNLDLVITETDAQVTSDPLPTVLGEAPLLTQVFQNLVSNAVKFRGEESPRVHVGARQVGEDWEFSVADNGIGIEAQYAERIFVIFQRLHPKDEYEGTGIGLALCRKIIEHHGGRIWLDTEVEHGTTFHFTLPVASPLATTSGQSVGEGDPIDRAAAPAAEEEKAAL